MAKEIVKIFPDYCSSGVWDSNGCNCDPDEFGISPGLRIALKYWHDFWEYQIANISSDAAGNPIIEALVPERLINQWREDGHKLAELMSAENDRYEFIARL